MTTGHVSNARTISQTVPQPDHKISVFNNVYINKYICIALNFSEASQCVSVIKFLKLQIKGFFKTFI